MRIRTRHASDRLLSPLSDRDRSDTRKAAEICHSGRSVAPGAERVAIVPKLSDTPGAVRWQGPKLGEHTDAVLARLGMTPGEIARLRERGVVQ